jgi:hypothetical protein
MKLIAIIPLSLVLLAASAFSQGPARSFDNFDTATGVNVILPPAPPAPKAFQEKERTGQMGRCRRGQAG